MLYLHLLLLIGDSTYLIAMHMQEKDICEETIARVDSVIGSYHMDYLNQNVTAGFHYQVAVYKATLQEEDEAYERLQKYVKTACALLKNGMLHGDSYFNRLDRWFEDLDLGTQMPRNRKLVLQSVRENLNNPAFAMLREKKDFTKMERVLCEVEREIDDSNR